MKRTVDASELKIMPIDNICANCGAKIEHEIVVQWYGMVCGFQCSYCGTWYERRGGIAETFRILAASSAEMAQLLQECWGT